MPLPELERLAKQFDAIQTHNIQHGINREAVRVADEYERPKIGGSDFHVLGQVGIVRTKIFQEVKNWQDLIQAIREGKTEPFFQQDMPEELIKRRYDRAPIILDGIKNRLKTIFS
ncbi:hypothetical protein KKC87_00145 [Patescibacteria group bacterium]|nr:hypothetical protein [Patescibacteria group bacterium]